MDLRKWLAVTLTCFAFAKGQYGTLKGSSARTTTPGLQTDDSIYNSVSNSLTPNSNQIGHDSNAAASCGNGGSQCGASESAESGNGSLAGANQKSPAGAISYVDNPWLSSIIAQNSGPGQFYQQATLISCNAPEHVCVEKHQCRTGQTTSSGTGRRECNSNTEVCCQYGTQELHRPPSIHQAPQSKPQPQPQYRPVQGYQPSQGSQLGSSYIPLGKPQPEFSQQSYPTYQPQPQPGQIYQSQAQPAPTYQAQTTPQPGQTYDLKQKPQSIPSQQPFLRPQSQPQPLPSFLPSQRPQPQPLPTYQQGQRPLPTLQEQSYYPGSQDIQSVFRPGASGVPIGGSIYDAGIARPSFSYVTPAPIGSYTGPLNTTPHPGCAAALKCVEEIYCDAKGVMQETPVQLTQEEFENRVPLSECQNIETGIIGKCCRDPNYKDPWPDMNGIFDDGHYHGEFGGAHPDHQHHPQGTTHNTCGSSASCTLQSQCSGNRKPQPGKHCRIPHDGSTGVCCSKPPFPSFTNNQLSASPATPAHRPTPGELYYTPRPQQSNNPFLPENQGKLPILQNPLNQRPIYPTGITPVGYRPTPPNAIAGSQKDYGKISTPKPPRPSYTPYQSPRPTASFPPQPSYIPPQSSAPAASFPPRPSYIPPQSSAPAASFPPRPSYVRPQSSATASSPPRPSYIPPQSSAPAASFPPRPSYIPPQSSAPAPSFPPRPSYIPPQSSAPTAPFPQPSYAPESPAVSTPFPQSSYSQSPAIPHPPSLNYPRPSSGSAYQQPSFVASTTSQPTFPQQSEQSIPGNYSPTPKPTTSRAPVFPQIATSSSYQPISPNQFSLQTSTPDYQQLSQSLPDTFNMEISSGSDVKTPQISTSAPPMQSNDAALAGSGQNQTTFTTTKGRGPPAGYPFLAPTTEANIKTSDSTPEISTETPKLECGVRNEDQRPNGPNGLETSFGEFPWQVQILKADDQNPLCSGAILAPKVIVTAAHCIDGLTSEKVAIKAGDWKLGNENQPDEPKSSQTKNAAAIARHPKYDPNSRFYDLAVIILASPLSLDSHVNILCLGESTPPGQKPRGNNCVITGWGKPNLQNNTPGSAMHSIPVNFIESGQCEDIFRRTNLGKYFQLNKSFICAAPTSSNYDLCQVDVGSPISCEKSDGHYELSGIYSWDVGCYPNPVATAKMDKQWIQSVMDKPEEQLKQEENEELKKKESLGFNPQNSDLTKPGFSQGYGK